MEVLDGIAAAQPSSSLRASTHVMQTRAKAKAEQARPGDALSQASPAGMAPASPDQEVDHQVWLGCEPSCRHNSGLSTSSSFVQAVTDGVPFQNGFDELNTEDEAEWMVRPGTWSSSQQLCRFRQQPSAFCLQELAAAGACSDEESILEFSLLEEAWEEEEEEGLEGQAEEPEGPGSPAQQ